MIFDTTVISSTFRLIFRQSDGTLCDKFRIQGTYEWVDEEKHRESNTIGDTIHVTELPAGKWVNDYKQFLEEGLELQEDKKKDDKGKKKAAGKGKKKAAGKGKKKKKGGDENDDDGMEIDDDEVCCYFFVLLFVAFD